MTPSPIISLCMSKRIKAVAAMVTSAEKDSFINLKNRDGSNLFILSSSSLMPDSVRGHWLVAYQIFQIDIFGVFLN